MGGAACPSWAKRCRPIQRHCRHDVRYCLIADKMLQRRDCPLCADRRHALVRKLADVLLGKLHKLQPREPVRALRISKALAHLEMIEVRRFDQFDWLASRLHGRGKIAVLTLEFWRLVGAVSDN